MEYNKQADGTYSPLAQKNVDTGLGVERVAMILEGKKNVYEIATIHPIIEQIQHLTNITKPSSGQEYSFRVITDHMRAATFILGDPKGITPSNVDQGYILRRFIRRSIRHFHLLKYEGNMTKAILAVAQEVIVQFGNQYVELLDNESFIQEELTKETERFEKTIKKGLSEIDKKLSSIMLKSTSTLIKSREDKDVAMQSWIQEKGEVALEAKWLFDMFQSQGMPLEMILEEVKQSYHKSIANEEQLVSDFAEEFKRHQELSRVGAEKKFKGGLADDSTATTRLHTATHLLNEALRKVLHGDIKQKGSNITAERLRFDFNFDRKLTDDEKQQVEDEVNRAITLELPITKEKMKLTDALASGAQAEFGARYPQEVWVYSAGDYAKEICTGPHVNNTQELGHFKIKKEEGIAAGVRRIKAVLE